MTTTDKPSAVPFTADDQGDGHDERRAVVG
jgi:hypothetical protein